MADLVGASLLAALMGSVVGSEASLLGAPIEVALLTGAPTRLSSGELFLGGVEVDDASYSRLSIDAANWTDPESEGSASDVVSLAGLPFTFPLAAAKYTVSHVALVSNDVTLVVHRLPSAVEVLAGKQFRVPIQGLRLVGEVA